MLVTRCKAFVAAHFGVAKHLQYQRFVEGVFFDFTVQCLERGKGLIGLVGGDHLLNAGEFLVGFTTDGVGG